MKYSDIKFDLTGETVIDWAFICLPQGRLHYNLTPDNGGFAFCALIWLDHTVGEMYDYHSEPDILCHGWAAFDGIRHLHFGDEQTDNPGYSNYPDMDTFIEAMQQLKILEETHCSDKLS